MELSLDINAIDAPSLEKTPVRRTSLFRRNTSRDLNASDATRKSVLLPPLHDNRPKSARVPNRSINKFDPNDKDYKVVLYESYGGRGSSMFDREYEARDVDAAPIVMSPETISRCICVLIRELMEQSVSANYGEFYSAVTTPCSQQTSEKAFFSTSPSKPSQYNVFRRDYKKHPSTPNASGDSHKVNSLLSPSKFMSLLTPSHKKEVQLVVIQNKFVILYMHSRILV